MPVQVLNPQPGSVVLDMCAAPGNKTTQIAAWIKNIGTVYAVELDKRRFETLESLIEKSGATCVKTINNDALKITDNDCPNVEYILVDPSCTGSGMINRLSFEKEEKDPSRIRKLHNFQVTLLKHALSHFPKAKRVVYSTCSRFKEENEEVVKEVLESCKSFELVSCKESLQAPWLTSKNQSESDNIGNYCISSIPETHFTLGFFVAAFARIMDDENPRNETEVADRTDCNQSKKSVKKDKKKNEIFENIKDTTVNNKKMKVASKKSTTENCCLKENKKNSKSKSAQKKNAINERNSLSNLNAQHQTNLPEDIVQKKQSKAIKTKICIDPNKENENINEKSNKKSKKAKKIDKASVNVEAVSNIVEVVENNENTKKKKKKSKKPTEESTQENVEQIKDKALKRSIEELLNNNEELENQESAIPISKKVKKRKSKNKIEEEVENVKKSKIKTQKDNEQNEEGGKTTKTKAEKKKKKTFAVESQQDNDNVENTEDAIPKRPKRKIRQDTADTNEEDAAIKDSDKKIKNEKLVDGVNETKSKKKPKTKKNAKVC